MKRIITFLCVIVSSNFCFSQIIFDQERALFQDDLFAPVGVVAIENGDIDGDGDEDVVVLDNSKVFWYENDGEGVLNSSQTHFINSFDNATTALEVSDLDSDGDLDIIILRRSADIVEWIENMGDGSFSNIQLIDDTIDAPISVHSYDVDSDGNFDLIIGTGNDEQLVWLRNEGGEVFSSAQVIADFINDPVEIVSEDIDGDGIDDIVAGLRDAELIWIRNEGGNFSSQVNFVLPEIGLGKAIAASDLDSDGDIDIVSTTEFPDLVVFLLNDGTGDFGEPIEVLNDVENILDLKVDDINNDGLKDIIVAELSPSRLLTFMNLGDTNDDTIIEFGNSVVVGSYPQNYSGSIISIDFNSSGVPDFVIPTSDNFIFQHRYISNNNYRQEMIGYGLFFVRDIQVADVDNDSDLDLVFSHDRSLSWMENKGNDEFSNPKLIFRLPENDFPRFQLGFIDDDNLLDIVTSGNDEIRIYTNSTTADFELVQTITTNRIFSVLFEDFDLDGDLDIVSNEMIVGSPNQINLYSNNDGTFAFDQLIGVISIGNTFKIISGDVDGDGDVDVVTQRVGWFENTGNGNFNDLEILINNVVDDFLLYDLDGDSLLDVIGINNSSSDIAFWSRNLGNGDFTGFNVISSLDDLNGFTVGDFDGDNDGDIILSSNASSNSSNQIIVNLDSGFASPSALPSIFGNAFNRVFLVSDINNDNRDDIITGYQSNGRFSVFTNATTLSIQDDIFSQNSLVLYPNPISDDNSILRFSDQIGAVVTIYDLKGTMLFSEKLTNDTIDLSRLSVGIYILKLTNGSTEQVAKLIRM